MHKTITLSDNKPCKVRALGLFELDNIQVEVLGPYSYSILTVTGQVLEDTYDLSQLDELPQKPDDDNPKPGSLEWKQLQEYETYQAAIAHEKKRWESYETYIEAVKGYILDNCLEPDDHNRIIEPDDWHKIRAAAVVPALTEEVIAATLAATFPGIL